MAITRKKKEEILSKVNEVVSHAGSVVFVNFKGLTVADTSEMRRTLRENGVSYYVAKKTIVNRALNQQSFTGTQPVLDGELALAWSDDLIAPAREVYAFVKKRKDNLSIQGGLFEGAYMSAGEMTEIATIPSRQTLYAQFVNLINSPIQQFVMAVDQIAQKQEA